MHDNSRLPFDIVLRGAIDSRGLTLGRVAKRLANSGHPVSIATLSNWQRGTTTPRMPASAHAVAQLETILELPSGALTSSLTPNAGVSREVPTTRDATPFTVGRLRASLGVASDDLVVVRRDVYVVVSPHELQFEINMTVRAKRTGVDRWVLMAQPDVGIDDDVTAGPTCQMGATRRDESAGLVAAELLFETALTRGELYPVSYRLRSPRADNSGHVVTWVKAGLASYSLTVDFQTTPPPLSVYQIWRLTPEAPHKRLDDLRLIGGRWAHLWLHEPPPGSHGVRWDAAD